MRLSGIGDHRASSCVPLSSKAWSSTTGLSLFSWLRFTKQNNLPTLSLPLADRQSGDRHSSAGNSALETCTLSLLWVKSEALGLLLLSPETHPGASKLQHTVCCGSCRIKLKFFTKKSHGMPIFRFFFSCWTFRMFKSKAVMEHVTKKCDHKVLHFFF